MASHFSANLTALLCVMRTARSTGRISRWRGQILHVCGILAVTLRDRGLDEGDDHYKAGLQEQLQEVFGELGSQCDGVLQVCSRFQSVAQLCSWSDLSRTSILRWSNWTNGSSHRSYPFNEMFHFLANMPCIPLWPSRDTSHALADAFRGLELHTDNHEHPRHRETTGVVHGGPVGGDSRVGTTTCLQEVPGDRWAKEITRSPSSDEQAIA